MFYVLEAVNIAAILLMLSMLVVVCDQTTAIQSTDGICAI